MSFILVPAIALLKTVGPGDRSGAALVTVLVSENQCTALIDFIGTLATLRQHSRAIRKTAATAPLPQGNATLIKEEFKYDMHIKEICSK